MHPTDVRGLADAWENKMRSAQRPVERRRACAPMLRRSKTVLLEKNSDSRTNPVIHGLPATESPRPSPLHRQVSGVIPRQHANEQPPPPYDSGYGRVTHNYDTIQTSDGKTCVLSTSRRNSSVSSASSFGDSTSSYSSPRKPSSQPNPQPNPSNERHASRNPPPGKKRRPKARSHRSGLDSKLRRGGRGRAGVEGRRGAIRSPMAQRRGTRRMTRGSRLQQRAKSVPRYNSWPGAHARKRISAGHAAPSFLNYNNPNINTAYYKQVLIELKRHEGHHSGGPTGYQLMGGLELAIELSNLVINASYITRVIGYKLLEDQGDGAYGTHLNRIAEHLSHVAKESQNVLEQCQHMKRPRWV